MSFNIIIIIFVVFSFVFMILQCYEFVQNYDYIINFNSRYNKYEFTASPSYNYVDKSFFDPNDAESDIKKKVSCKLYDGRWFGFAPTYGLATDDIFNPSFETEADCIKYIFSNHFYLNYYQPCKAINTDIDNTLCIIFNKLTAEQL